MSLFIIASIAGFFNPLLRNRSNYGLTVLTTE